MDCWLVQKKLTFLSIIFFVCAASSWFCQHEILFCATSIFSVDMKHIFTQHQLGLVDTRLLFVQHQTFCLGQKIAFCATPSFCFAHCLECYIMVIYLYCHVATKIGSKLLYSIFTLYIGNMLIFFVVFLKTKKLLIHHLLPCRIYRTSYSQLPWKRMFLFRPVETGETEGWGWGWEGRVAAPQIFSNVDLLRIENDSDKKKIAKKCKLVQILLKLLVTFLLSISRSS